MDGQRQNTRDEVMGEVSKWGVGFGILVVALAPLSIPILLLTAVALLPLLVPLIALGLVAAIVALPVVLVRRLVAATKKGGPRRARLAHRNLSPQRPG
jgi:hypothetical protein